MKQRSIGPHEKSPPKPEAQKIFVYGTLLSGFPQTVMPGARDNITASSARARSLLAEMASLLGPSSVCGLLFDLGGYPGLVLPSQAHSSRRPSATDMLVTGELYRVLDTKLFHELDLYEEAGPPFSEPQEYKRHLLQVRLKKDGSTHAAWTYVYSWTLQNSLLIETGDYLKHLKSQKN